MKNNVNRVVLILAIIVVAVWMIRKYMQGRELRENYEMNKVGLMEYIGDKEVLDPTYVMASVAKLTKDEDIIMRGYELASADDRDSLRVLVSGL
jgi:hypothetical protein